MKGCNGEASLSFTARGVHVGKTIRCPLEAGHGGDCEAHVSITPVPGYSLQVKVSWSGPSPTSGTAVPPPAATQRPGPWDPRDAGT